MFIIKASKHTFIFCLFLFVLDAGLSNCSTTLWARRGRQSEDSDSTSGHQVKVLFVRSTLQFYIGFTRGSRHIAGWPLQTRWEIARDRNWRVGGSFPLMSQGREALKKGRRKKKKNERKQWVDIPRGQQLSVCLALRLFWVCAVQHEPSAAGLSIYRSAGRLHSGLNCKQVTYKKPTADPTASFNRFKVGLEPQQRLSPNKSAIC